MLTAYGWTSLVMGALAAWVSAFVAVKWMVGYLKRHGLESFGYYRILLAVLVATALFASWLPD